MIIQERATQPLFLSPVDNRQKLSKDSDHLEVMGPFVPTYIKFACSRAELLSESLKGALKDLQAEDSPENWQHFQRVNRVVEGFLNSNPWLQWHEPSQEDQ